MIAFDVTASYRRGANAVLKHLEKVSRSQIHPLWPSPTKQPSILKNTPSRISLFQQIWLFLGRVSNYDLYYPATNFWISQQERTAVQYFSNNCLGEKNWLSKFGTDGGRAYVPNFESQKVSGKMKMDINDHGS